MNVESIKQLAAKYNLTPSRTKGQNFLINEKIVDQIVEVAGVNSESGVLEVGPGLGILTQALTRKAKKVLVVELDKKAIEFLKGEFGLTKNFEMIEGDILRIKNAEVAERLGGEYQVVANIPYNITSKLISNLLSYTPKPKSLTLMVQHEVAQRITAPAGETSMLSLACQLYAKCEYVFKVGKENFWPAPAVNSAVVKIELNDDYLKKLKVSEKDFFRVAKFGFVARRKKLVNNLAAGLRISGDESMKLLEKIGAGPNSRAQELSIDQWIQLANIIYG